VLAKDPFFGHETVMNDMRDMDLKDYVSIVNTKSGQRKNWWCVVIYMRATSYSLYHVSKYFLSYW
jgi:hypothetical protein